jgi:hypothetical protein
MSDEAMARDSHILKEELLRLQKRADEVVGLKTGVEGIGNRE